MKNLSIILACVLVAMISCTKSKEIHPELGDGNDEIVTVGMSDVHVEYARTDHAELSRVLFHFCPADANGNAQQFEAVEMMKKESFFELTLNDLLSDTLYWYYYELFPNGGSATNTTQKTFRTQAYDAPDPPTPPTPPSDAPEGAINGLFTINENGDQVYFSQGNLQYQASTNTWRFAENQWSFVGGNEDGVDVGNVFENGVKCDNIFISSTYDGWIDLFGWGTSGWDNGNIYYHPWDSVSFPDAADFYGPYGGGCDLTGSYANSDWGHYNIISNGGDDCLWRTLTQDEWSFLINDRNTLFGLRYVYARVNDVNGLIILPDTWNLDTFPFNTTYQSDDFYSANVITHFQWNILQNAGAVFLPAAGLRAMGRISYINAHTLGHYHSSSYDGTWYDSGSCWVFTFYDDCPLTCNGHCTNSFGCSVRLVQDAN